MLTKEQAMDEAKKQKAALNTIAGWRGALFLMTGTLVILAVFGLRRGGWFFAMGAAAAVLAGLGGVLLFLMGLSIRNGHRNVERILKSLQAQESQEGSAVS